MPLLLSKVVQALTLATCIRELPTLNLGRDLNPSLLSLVCPGECCDSTLNWATTVSFLILSNALFTSCQSFCGIYIEVRAASLYKLQVNTKMKIPQTLYEHDVITVTCSLRIVSSRCRSDVVFVCTVPHTVPLGSVLWRK
jgi:hypothetical protein